MSFRDIGYILKKEGLSHGIVTVEKDRDDDTLLLVSMNTRITSINIRIITTLIFHYTKNRLATI
jgi:uncharacterized protein YuzE